MDAIQSSKVGCRFSDFLQFENQIFEQLFRFNWLQCDQRFDLIFLKFIWLVSRITITFRNNFHRQNASFERFINCIAWKFQKNMHFLHCSPLWDRISYEKSEYAVSKCKLMTGVRKPIGSNHKRWIYSYRRCLTFHCIAFWLTGKTDKIDKIEQMNTHT